MDNHMKNMFWPLTHQNPNCTLCHLNGKDTWPHLLSTCKYPYLKGLRIAHHNKAIHLITQTLQANKNTQFLTLTNVGKLNNKLPEQTIPYLLLQCTCSEITCQRQAKLLHDIMCIIGAPHPTQTPIEPSPTHNPSY
jgi:hypothetical protein